MAGGNRVKTDAELQASDIEIGAVELQDKDGTNRAVIDSSGALSSNVTKIGSQAVNLGAGAAGTGTQRVIEASDSPDVVSLQIIDDWDESDRAKVNPIVGQAGVAAGVGGLGATVQRVVHASASGLTTGQNALSTNAEEVIAANANRLFCEVTNSDVAINVFIGDDNAVTSSNGHILKPGASLAFENYTGAVWAVAASGTPTVTFIEW